MHPDTARQIIEAWRNHHRPGRTRDARVMDAVQHDRISQKEKAGVTAGLNISGTHNENPNTPDQHPHLQQLPDSLPASASQAPLLWRLLRMASNFQATQAARMALREVGQ